LALCPACFNPPAGCDCDPKFSAEADATAQHRSHRVAGSARRVGLEWVNGHVTERRRHLTQRVLEELETTRAHLRAAGG
jgi:hypothetical protein